MQLVAMLGDWRSEAMYLEKSPTVVGGVKNVLSIRLWLIIRDA